MVYYIILRSLSWRGGRGGEGREGSEGRERRERREGRKGGEWEREEGRGERESVDVTW